MKFYDYNKKKTQNVVQFAWADVKDSQIIIGHQDSLQNLYCKTDI